MSATKYETREGIYGEYQVVGSEEQASRVRMWEATLEVMRKCFFLLGMEPLDRI